MPNSDSANHRQVGEVWEDRGMAIRHGPSHLFFRQAFAQCVVVVIFMHRLSIKSVLWMDWEPSAISAVVGVLTTCPLHDLLLRTFTSRRQHHQCRSVRHRYVVPVSCKLFSSKFPVAI